MKKIPLTQGQFALVDDEDFKYLNQWKWYFHKRYAIRNSSRSLGNRHLIYMHRVILNTPNDLFIDHKNSNGLDNRKENLRFASKSQNSYNIEKTKTKTASKFKGVYWHKIGLRWCVTLNANKKRYYVGLFDSEIEAAKAYNKKALQLHGEFARINEI